MAGRKENSPFSFISNMVNDFLLSSLPKVKAQEEEEADLVDAQATLRENCNTKPQIESLFHKYQACNTRVRSKSKTAETCVEEFFDYMHELDHCVAHHLWPKLN